MSNIPDDYETEQQRVHEVTELIRNRLERITDENGEIKSEIVDIKRNFWEDVTVNFEDAAETAETYASMKQQAELLSERERSQRLLRDQVKLLHKLEMSPYFGRIDISEDGGSVEAIYLGVGSLLDDQNDKYLVYDWRAPISSVYYDYGPGPITYRTPNGAITGEMTLKRQYIIRYGKLLSMFDTGVTIGDEILQNVLGKHSDAQMKSIVATIQQEQNAIIRNEHAKLLVVQGPAGSGKTSAALQRVAYLLYRFRESLTAEQIVLFSPNPMFNSYVSTVLPELGEQNMQQTTYGQYLEHRLGKAFELEDQFQQMEYCLTGYDDPDYDTIISSIKLKGTTAFMEYIDRYVQQLGHAGMQFKSIVFRGKVLISKKKITEMFYSLDPSLNIPIRLRELTTQLLKELTALSKEEQKESWVDEELELLGTEQFVEAFQQLKRKKQYHENSFNDYEAERNFLAARIVQEKFKKIRRQVKLLKYIDMPMIYCALFHQEHAPIGTTNALWRSIAALTEERLIQKEMPYEDATPYLYLKERLEGFSTNTAVKYVFIDEGQDYSPFQLHYLKRIFPRSRMTIVGDINQSIFVHASTQDSFSPFENLYGEQETEYMTLLRSYRSTQEIIEFTAKMIEGGDQIVPFNRHGKEPVVTVLESDDQYDKAIDEVLHGWLREGYESVAIICKTAMESAIVYERFADRWKTLSLINQETVTFEKGIMVIPAYLAKGVEFDCVLIYDASSANYHLESERKLFYTACTRAMHELQLFSLGQPSPFLD
ncbi:RNA polymerase recycling motor HelD [Paenibacillus septentrionalis]|uniref:RNA polymerase recycling motor HelD n=1 Tax=Paenibacillus septentrionalis TaxID=429342 RepID=A0ABW1V4W7_9BACL